MCAWRKLTGLLVCSIVLIGAGAMAADSAEGLEFFERRIRPVLVAECYGCHSEKAREVKGGYLLDTRNGIRRGGESGRDAVIPGDVAGSQLIEAIRYRNPKLQMPPEGRLPDKVVADFERWVAMGAPDPRDGPAPAGKAIAAGDHWAWRRPERGKLPAVRQADWPRDAIDCFVLAGLEARGMRPNPEADRRTLIRRATLELIGLPPEPRRIREFLADPRPTGAAFAAVVDRLLADPGFGERWGRHWLDVARFGESSGYSRNMLFAYAWRYRNWVIDSLNADKPYDRFVREQIAGDLLPAGNYAQREDQALGTGFLTVGAKTFNEGNALLFQLNCADDQIDATCRAFLALTVNCARCHDHKYDPIPTRDYYALSGIFQSTRNLAGAETNVRNEHSEAYPLGPEGFAILERIQRARRKADETQARYLELVRKRNELREPLIRRGIDWKKQPTPELKKAEAEVQAFQAEVRAAREAIPPPPRYAMAVVDGLKPSEVKDFEAFLAAEKEEIAAMKKAGKRPRDPTPARPGIADSPLYDKGLPDAPLDPVPRGVLSLFDYPAAPVGPDESGRLQLARWITDRRNPLAARVMVNRVWHHLFGRGLVETVDNFGALGARPSHPELLDYLAVEFMEDGWSVKRLIRRIVLSRTWRQSSSYVAGHAARDPEARWLWRFPPHLLEGEAIRDGILAVSGRLDRVRLATSQVAEISRQQALGRQREIGRRDYYTKDVNWDVLHRSVYLPMARGLIPDMLAVFDAADPNLVTGARKLTIVPAQALYLANSEMVIGESIHTARWVLRQPSRRRRPDAAFERILGREPDAAERRRIEAFVERNGQDEKTWARICQSLICSGEFRTIY